MFDSWTFHAGIYIIEFESYFKDCTFVEKWNIYDCERFISSSNSS
jgi:hypothetical protein